MKQRINIILLVGVALVSIWCTGDLMRKNDQAAILAGAYDLAHGRVQDWTAYYQYDKTYVLYWTTAAIFKAQQWVRCNADPVAAANMGIALAFWSALTVFVVYFRKKLSPLALLCFLTAPAVLLNTLYVNSSVLSSAFLLLSSVFLLQKGRKGGWPGALFFALAVGSRADIILLLPLLLWIITPFPMIGTFLSSFSKPRKNRWLLPREALKGNAVASKHWTLIGSGLLALGAGPLLCGGPGVSLDLLFNAKMVAGYLVFGFGAAGLIFLVYAAQLFLITLRTRGGLEKVYTLAGLAALLLPVLFFLPQLHSPRYFWRACEALLILSASGRLPSGNRRVTVVAICLAAVLPLIIGVRLPALNRPQISTTNPTLFPSGDGHYPMGGTLPFMFRLRNASTCPVDHNQRIWKAVRQTEFEVDEQGTVPVLSTPMSGQLLFGASLQGKTVRRASFAALSGATFYSDSRSLMRDDPKSPVAALAELLALPTRFASPALEGIGVLQFGQGDDCWGRQTQLLNHLFAGNEYRVVSGAGLLPSNRRITHFSEQPFDGSRVHERTGLYYLEGRSPPLGAGVQRAVSVFPSWMSLQAFKGSGQ